MSIIKSLRISAPGKIILCGEHAVVYGKKALACSINLRTNAYLQKLTDSNENSFKIKFKNLNDKVINLNEQEIFKVKSQFSNEKNVENIICTLKGERSDDQLNAILLLILLLGEKISFEHISNYVLEIETELPIGAGLGSSASLSSCLVTVFLILTKTIQPNRDLNFTREHLDLVNEYTFNIEKLFHGRPSGIDNSIVLNGNYIVFKNGQVHEKFKSNINLNILIINSNLPKQTREQVAKVKQLKENFSMIGDSLINTIDLIADQFMICLKKDGYDERDDQILSNLIRMNQGLLYSLDISNHKLNEIVNISNKYNFPCKITGAGGGGCLFALISDDENFKSYLNELNNIEDISHFKSILGCEGIRVENISYL